MKRSLLHLFLAAFTLLIFLTSCVSKKKYVNLQRSSNTREEVFKNEKRRLQTESDSLRYVLSVKDSTIDSLRMKFDEIAAKREKEKARVAAAPKKSTLSKEQEYDKKSLFIYNFTKYVEWPVEYNGTEFIIAVAGDDHIIKQLQEFMSQRKVSGKTIIVEKYKKGKKYNVVYITSSDNSSFQSIKNAINKSKTLLVTDENMQGSHISFILDQEKIRYLVDKIAIEKTGLKVGQDLMRYSG